MYISSLTTKSQQEAAHNHEQFKAATRRSSRVRKQEDKKADLCAFPLHPVAMPMHPDALEMPNANPKPLDLAAVTHDSDKCNVNQGDKENKSMSAAIERALFNGRYGSLEILVTNHESFETMSMIGLCPTAKASA